MTEKELKHLGRSDLIDIIYQLQKNEENLVKMNENLKARLASKELKIENAGSLAEAAIAVSGVFEKAQLAADMYLSELQKRSNNIEQEYNARIAEAKEEAAQILAEAERKAKARIAVANKAIQNYLEEHPELRPALACCEEGKNEG